MSNLSALRNARTATRKAAFSTYNAALGAAALNVQDAIYAAHAAADATYNAATVAAFKEYNATLDACVGA